VGTVKTDGHALGEAAVRMNMRSRIVTIVTEPGLPPIQAFQAFLPVQVAIAKKSCSP
jgi:hypothetical protein